MLTQHGPHGKGGVLLGGAHGPLGVRSRKASTQLWSWTTALLLAATFLVGYLAGGGLLFSGTSSPSTSSSEFATRSSQSWNGQGKGGLHAEDRVDLLQETTKRVPRASPLHKNMTFEEIISISGALDDRPALPASEIGSTGHPFYTVQPMQLLSWHPRAYIFPKFIDTNMAQHVIDLASKRLVPSGLALRKGDSLDSTREIRTSQGTFMSRGDDPEGVLAYIEDKIAVLTGIPAGHGEAFNILRYENGQHYDSHYDSFDEEGYGKQSSQRIATVLVYLSDVEEGGETSFLFEGIGGTERIKTVDYKACDTGIKYRPRAGDALLFWSIHPDMTRDKHSLHGGCPVVKGTKWTATKWIRDKCMSSGGSCSGEGVP